MNEEEQKSFGFLLSRYFLHGFLFSIVFLLLVLGWAVVLIVLVAFGAIIGLILGLILLLFIIGGLNTFLMKEIWGLSVKGDWKSLLVHGLILFLVLFIVSIPSFVVNAVFPSIPIQIIVFIVYCFIDGYVARGVGGGWEEQTDYNSQ